jgi:hypothetical protein
METGSNISSAKAFPLRSGVGTITAGQVTVNVPHGLGVVPTGYSCDPAVNSLGVDIYIESVDATNLKISMDFVQAADVNFSWMAE